MNVLITGGSGLVGSALTDNLLQKDYEVRHLTRSKKGISDVREYTWNISEGMVEKEAFENVDAVIHLAGESVAEKRWTPEQKSKIISSRVDSAQLLYDAISTLEKKPTVIISASGVGFYGVDTGDVRLTEENDKGDGFLADVVDLWESGINKFSQLGMRVVKLRIGVVLAKEGGALSKMMLPVKFGVGAALGKGKQQMSWIHVDDLCQMISHSINNGEMEGVYNAVSSNPVTNKVMTRSIARALKKPMFMPNVPEFVLRLMLGEMSVIVTGGNYVSNEKIKSTGFTFEYEDLDDTLSKF